MNTQLKKGVLELCTLTMLCDRDRYGYELTESISQEISISPGTLYLVLRRLKDEAYVDTYLTESSNGPARKYYHLTEKGREYQIQLKEEWLDFSAAVDRLIHENDPVAADETAVSAGSGTVLAKPEAGGKAGTAIGADPAHRMMPRRKRISNLR